VAEDFSAPLAAVIGNKHLLEVFATEVNSIECSLIF
jgi:hypothetical protein